MAEEPYIPRDLMGVPIPQSAAEEIIGEGTPSGDDPQGISQQQVNSYLLNERPPQGISQQVIQGSPVHGYINADIAPETSTPTQTASSAGISGVLNVADLLQLSGRYNRGDAEEKLPENIKRQFGLQNREHRYRGYEGTATVKPSEVLNGIAPDWMTLDKVSVTYGQGRNRLIDEMGGVHKSGTRTRGAEIAGGIGDLGLTAEYMERGLYDNPNSEFSASATYPLGDGRIYGEFRRNLNSGSQKQREFSAGAIYPLEDGQVSGEFRRNLNSGPRQKDETYVGANFTTPFQEGGIVLPNPPKPDNSQAERSAINRQQYLEDEVPLGEEWPDQKYLATSELLDRSVLPGGERDPLLNPDRPRTVDGEPVPVTDAEYMMREAGRFPNRQNPLALIGRDETLEKTATADMRDVTARGVYTPPEHAYENLSPGKKYLIGKSDRPELLDDPGGSVITAAETFDEEFGPQVILQGTPAHEWIHAGLNAIRKADPDFELPKFPSKYAVNDEEMWVRLIHAHTEDLSAVPVTEPLAIDERAQFDDDGFVRQEILKTKLQEDRYFINKTGEDTDYWLSQPSAIRGINSILEKANEVGRELGSFAVTETPSDRAQFAPGGQRRYEGAEISARQPFQEGGIASLPQNPVLGGQQHMLAYITPEEASTLRAQGGGVTPDGGQYTGPGGIASFMTGMGDGPGQSGLGSTASGGTGSTGTGIGNPFSGYANPFSGLSNASDGDGDGGGSGKNNFDKAVESLLSRNPYGDTHFSPFSNNDTFGDTGDFAYSAVDLDGTPVSRNTINAQVEGDPNSVFGQAVSAFGLAALGLLSPALSIPTTVMSLARAAASEPGDPPTSVMGLIGDQASKAFGYKSASEAANDVASEVGLGDSPVGDVTSVFSGLAGDAFSGLGDAVSNVSLGPPTASTPSVPGGPGLPPVELPASLIPQYAPVTTTETLLDATSSDYTAEQLAQSTGSTVAQAQAYLDSRYPQQLT